jgi:choline dehydrogenase-like flavoprotein
MTTDFDVVIVGSGPTGATYARILSEEAPHLTLAVIEVGPILADPPGIHVKNLPTEQARTVAQRASEGPAADASRSPAFSHYGPATERLVRPGTFLLRDGYQADSEDGLPAAAMSSNVGGMAAHWTCACPRPGDSERIPFLPDLDELLTEAERLLDVQTDAFPDAPLASAVRYTLAALFDDGREADRRVAPMPLAVRVDAGTGVIRWSGSDVVFGEPTRSNPRFTLMTETLAVGVLLSSGQVTGVRVRNLTSGLERDVRAHRVVVAGDSLRTPQLLWASGIRPEALGRYLNDQPQVIYAARLRRENEDSGHSSERTERPANGGVNWVPFTDDHPFHGQVMRLDASPVKLAVDDVPEPGSIVGLGWFCAKDLQSTDRVAFDDDTTDAYGMPGMRIRYQLSPADHQNIAAAKEAVQQAALAIGEPLGDDPVMLPTGASLHYQGTVRMGPVDDGTSVCSPNSEVWGVHGLYVAGNGVIPTATACNPTLTSVAIAVRGARHLKQSLG